MVSSFFAGYTLHGGLSNGSGSQNFQQPTGSQPFQPQLGVAPPPSAPPAPVRVSSIPLDGFDIRGKQDAPVTMVEYSDFQCPFCERFFKDTLPQLQKQYIDTGKVKFIYKQFPVESVHPNSPAASLASECANEQGKFWPFHDALFANRTQWENLNGNQTTQIFKKYADGLNLDSTKFNSCLDSKKYQDKVTKESQEALTNSVSGTPTFYIGNDKAGYTQIVGTQPFTTFQADY